MSRNNIIAIEVQLNLLPSGDDVRGGLTDSLITTSSPLLSRSVVGFVVVEMLEMEFCYQRTQIIEWDNANKRNDDNNVQVIFVVHCRE